MDNVNEDATNDVIIDYMVPVTRGSSTTIKAPSSNPLMISENIANPYLNILNNNYFQKKWKNGRRQSLKPKKKRVKFIKPFTQIELVESYKEHNRKETYSYIEDMKEQHKMEKNKKFSCIDCIRNFKLCITW